jgi:hypothetical protein
MKGQHRENVHIVGPEEGVTAAFCLGTENLHQMPPFPKIARNMKQVFGSTSRDDIRKYWVNCENGNLH